jgi:hypothetical protein
MQASPLRGETHSTRIGVCVCERERGERERESFKTSKRVSFTSQNYLTGMQ